MINNKINQILQKLNWEPLFKIKAGPVLFVLTALTMFSFIVFYIFKTYKIIVNTDITGYLLFAREILETGSYFPKTFAYGEGVPIFSYHTLAIVFYYITENLFLTHNLVMFSVLLTILSLLYLALRKAQLERTSIIILVSIIASGISRYITQFVFGDGGYGYLFLNSILLLYLVFSILGQGEPVNIRISRKKQIGYYLLFFIVVVINVLNDYTRALVFLAFPTLAALVVYSYFEQSSNRTGKQALKLVLLLLFSTFIAFQTQFLFKSIFGISNTINYTLAEPNAVGWDAIKRNFEFYIHGHLFIFDAIPTGKIKSFQGMISAARLILLLGLYCLPFFLIFKYSKIQNRFFRYFIIFYFIHFSIVTYTAIFGSVNNGILSSRYFILHLLYAVIVFIFFFDEYLAKKIKYPRFSIWLLLLPLYIHSYDYLIGPYGKYITNEKGVAQFKATQHHLQHLIDFLMEKNVPFGYASYFHSGIQTVFSDFKTQINPVTFINGLPHPNPLGSSSDWYRASYYKGRSCLILTHGEYGSQISKERLDHYMGKPKEFYRLSSFVVLVYDFNIASKLPLWDSGIGANEKYGADDFNASISSKIKQMKVTEGEEVSVDVLISNHSSKKYTSEGHYPIRLGGHLLNEHSAVIQPDFYRSDIQLTTPGATETSTFKFKAPKKGSYILEIDMLQETVAWFSVPSVKSENFEKIRIELIVN
jgi:hypothetical protein